MYRIRKSTDIDFAHHVRGHMGACINLHGHTWKFEVELGAMILDDMGFVIDFGDLKRKVLTPAHQLLDHSLALPKLIIDVAKSRRLLREFGKVLVATRQHTVPDNGLGYLTYGDIEEISDNEVRQMGPDLAGAFNEILGGIKIAVFPFSPTSERLAQWLYELAVTRVADDRVRVLRANIYETLHPVEAVASYSE